MNQAEPSKMLGDRYQVGEVIGRGGMAEVHEGRDLRLGRRVAIKILRPDLAKDPTFQARFRREAQSAAAISHNTLNELKNVKCPTLVIGGKNDTFTPKWMSEQVAAAIPGADLHLYDNAGHAFHWECLGDFNPRTTEWLLKH